MAIKWKLIISFGSLLFLLAVFGFIVTEEMADVEDQFRYVIRHDAPVIANANLLLKLAVDMETGQRGFCLTQNEDFLEPYSYAQTKFDELLEVEKQLVSDNPSQVIVLGKISELITEWYHKAATPEISKAREIISAKDKNGQYKATKELAVLIESGTGKALIDEIRKEFAKFIKTEEQLTRQRYTFASKKTLNIRKTTLILIILAVLFSVIIVMLTHRAIINPIRRLVNGMENIGSGNLNGRIKIEGKDEIGHLSISFNRMAEKLEQAKYRISIEMAERKRAEEKLAHQKQRLSYILEGTNVGTWEWNVQTGEVIFNERWAEIIGYTLKEISPISIDTWMKFCHPDDLKKSGELLERHFNGKLGYYEFEARMRHKNGSWIWVLDRGKVSAWTDKGEALMMFGTHQDISKRKKTEEKIRHMANHDGLTDLPSLRLAKDRLHSALSIARRNKTLVGVLFIDLDGFKAVNDTKGHDAGDMALKKVASRLLSCVRETDTIARIGGDEFMAILTALQSSEDAGQVAEKIILNISKTITLDEGPVNIGSSIGIALFPDHGEEPENLIKKADTAMYNVKKSGKNGSAMAD
ncbi:MAG: diguanylate cyclase [Desulfobacteraceae bacterium]|nr:diguanylate cyclase [Desulfobacteraceae bacterium]